MVARRIDKPTREKIYEAIDKERNYQDGWKDPTLTTSGGLHSNVEFLCYIRDYVEEALHIATRKPDPEANNFCKHSLRKIAALAVSAMEQNGVIFRDTQDNLKERHK